MKLTKKQLDQILECFQQQHLRGGVDSAEVEHLLMIMFKNIDQVNQILEKWNQEEDNN